MTYVAAAPSDHASAMIKAMSDPPPADARPLFGRDAEQRLISSLLADIRQRGGALVLTGDPGIGKSRLLAEAAARAQDGGIATLSTAGIHSEAHLPFAGLHLLLRPVRAHATKLPPVLATALDSAFGLTDDPAPSPFRTAMAVLDLLSEAATDQPLLVLVEDAHWLDRPTADVLSFVARRVDSDPIVLLSATRDGYDSPCSPRGFLSTGSKVSTTKRPSRCSRPRPADCPRRFAPAFCARPRATRSRCWNSRSRRIRRPTTPHPVSCP
jgi:hypothetical protein